MTTITPPVTDRIEKIKEHLLEHNIDAALISKAENVFYYSGFNPVLNSHPCFVLIPSQGDAILLIHCIRDAHARSESSLQNIMLYGKWGDRKPISLSYIDAIAMLLPKQCSKLAIEFDNMNIQLYRSLSQQINMDNAEDISPFINAQRIIKDSYEIDCLRKSSHITDVGVETAIEFLKKGYSEAEACTEAQYAMRKVWHEKYPDYEVAGFGSAEGGAIDSFYAWSLTNERIAYGCDCPKHYHPKSGDITLPMAWAKINGYNAENERTILVGDVKGVRKTAYEAMIEARKAVFEKLVPGETFDTLYRAATKVYTDFGFESILPGRIGHGIGCSAHEHPSIAKNSEVVLKPGLAFTIEPGIMDATWGGARHSDSVVITEDGYECMTKLFNGVIQI